VFSFRTLQTDGMSVARTARERVHEEVSAEILAVARTHLARDGATALSLRSIARDVGMAPSAIYRYYPGRDALLSALILSAYGSLADDAERASAKVFATGAVAGDAERWLAVPRAMRGWALAHPHEWSLIFGTPVPGYQAPQDTVVPYGRLATALVRPVVAAHEDGRLQATRPTDVSDQLRDAVQPVTDALLPGMPATVVLLLQVWTTLIGAISLELFGHWHNTVLAPELFFDEMVRQAAARMGLI
jgi:AcrR family transcriptional regulator